MIKRDENEIAFSILLQATLTSPKPGEPPRMRSWQAYARHQAEGAPGRARELGKRGADARWGTQEERDNPHMTKRQHLDMSQLAKRILDEATGDEPKTEPPPAKNAAAVALGKLGGKSGGAARAASLTPEQRSEIAKKAAAERWKKA